jgi:hypothetical protein
MSWNRRNYDRNHAYRMLSQLAALPATIDDPQEQLTLYLREDEDARAAYVRKMDEDARLADAERDAWRM